MLEVASVSAPPTEQPENKDNKAPESKAESGAVVSHKGGTSSEDEEDQGPVPKPEPWKEQSRSRSPSHQSPKSVFFYLISFQIIFVTFFAVMIFVWTTNWRAQNGSSHSWS